MGSNTREYNREYYKKNKERRKAINAKHQKKRLDERKALEKELTYYRKKYKDEYREIHK